MALVACGGQNASHDHEHNHDHDHGHEHADEANDAKAGGENLFFIGQDLGAIRGYVGADCCVAAQGTTTYIAIHNVLDEASGFGGIGLNNDGSPSDIDADWGSGLVNSHKSATEFGDAKDLAIGLFIAENNRADAMEELVNGEHDDKIRHLAKLFTYVDGTVYLRIGYEFDGTWNQGYENTEEFVTGWRRIVDVLRAEGADNVKYVWHASASPTDDILEQKHEDLMDWWPGDDYVDWVGISWFVNPDEKMTVEGPYMPHTGGQLAQEMVDIAREKGLPLLIAEAAPQAFDTTEEEHRFHSPIWDGPASEGLREASSEEIWDYWFAPLFKFMNDNDDVVDGLAYINVDWDSQPMWGAPHGSGFWGDTRIETNAAITEKWNAAMNDWQKKDAE